MKPTNEEWIIKTTNNILDSTDRWEIFLKKGYEYLKDEYPYNNKKAYLDAIKNSEIPKIFCIDVDNREVTYLHYGVIKKTLGTHAKRFQFVVGKNRSISGVLTNLSALMSGKKQVAVAKVARDRRMLDGTYRGTEQMHATKTKDG